MADEPQVAAPSFDTPPGALDQMTAARADGYEWNEIGSHLAKGSLEANADGYTQTEIDNHLGYDTGGFHADTKQLAVGRLADDPDTLDDIHSGSPFELPTMRSDYAAALYNGTAKGPDDFASGVAAATLDAAHSVHGLDDGDPEMVRRRQAMAQDAADGLASTLPQAPDLVDAALHLSNGDAEPTPWLMKNLLDHWTDTGQQPVDAALAAETNDDLHNKLTLPPGPNSAFPDGRAPTLEELSQPARDAIEKVDIAGEQFILDQPDIPHAIAALGLEVAGAHALGLVAKDIAVPLARMAMDKLKFIPEWIGKALEDAPPVKVVDLADATGATKEVSARAAVMPAKPAAMIKFPEGTAEGPGLINPTASPAEKIQRILQLEDERAASDAGIGTSTFFQDLIAKAEKEGVLQPDQELTRLAEAHDTSRNMLSTFRDLLGSEEGAVAIPAYNTPAVIAKRDAFTKGRDYARDMLTKTQGNTDRYNAGWAKQLEPFYKLENANRAEWEAELAKGPAGAPMTTKLGQTLDYMEGRSAGTTLANNEFKPFADTVRTMNQELDKEMRQRDLDGTITYKGYIQDHVRHYGVNPAKVEETFLGSGRFGDRGALKERKYPTYGDLIANGLEPKYRSIIDGELKNATGTTTFLHYADMLKEMRDNFDKGGPGLYWGFHPRLDGDIAIDHPVGRNAVAMEQTVAKQAAATKARADRNAAVAAARAQGTVTKAQLDAIRAKYNPIIEAGKPEAGIQYLYGNRGLVQEINKWSARRFNTETGAAIYDNLMQAKNMSTAMKLLVPLAHAGQVSFGSIASGFGQAMEETARGQLFRALNNTAKSVTMLPNVVSNYARGRGVIRDYVARKNDPVINYLTEAGFRPINPRAVSGEALGGDNLWTSYRRGALARELKEDVKAIRGDPKTETNFKRNVRTPDRIVQFGFKEAQRLMTTATAPMFEHAIPSIKAGAVYDRMNSWLEANTTASHEAKMLKAQQIVSDVDNRLGELNFNNVFWNHTAKQSMNVAMLSSSWAYGTYRGIASALGYNIDRARFEFNPTASTSLIGFGLTYVLANNIMQFLHTGTVPLLGQPGTKWQENFNYRTASGKHGFIFSEIKEMYDLGKIVATAAGRHDFSAVGPAFADYAFGKLNPVGRFAHDFFKGEDAIGHKIAYTPGGWMKYLNDNFGPIFTQSFDKLKKGTGLTKPEIAAGWRAAPLYVENPQAYLDQQKGLADKWTKEELRRAQRENADLENPDPTIGQATPSKRGSSAGGGNTRPAGSGDYAPRYSGEEQFAPRYSPGDYNARTGAPASQFAPRYGDQPARASAGPGRTRSNPRRGNSRRRF